ncbi:MAG: hypothetical protein KDK97_15385 [Verrucomicrobiales bacterium]|nr:hypothetical protein [Verrucomicrobiales bacterium]MCP5560465.1 hypothetical protein [Verrucomicrobiaceae bacterium]
MSEKEPTSSQPAWYVVHAKPKCEHMAAGMIADLPDVQSYCPRIRFQRSTRRGKVWFMEALFPGYFFARFTPAASYRAVKHAQNVLRVLEFGGQLAQVADSFIAELKEEMQHEDIRLVEVPIALGDEVEVTAGPMQGLRGIVSSLTNAKERVRILMEFLGRENLVEVHTDTLLTEHTPRSVIGKK